MVMTATAAELRVYGIRQLTNTRDCPPTRLLSGAMLFKLQDGEQLDRTIVCG